MLFHIQSWGEKMLIFLFELKIKPKNFKSWNVVSYFLLIVISYVWLYLGGKL